MKFMNVCRGINLIVIKYGEIWLKSPAVKRKFENILIYNISKALESKNINLKNIFREESKIYINSDDEDKILPLLNKIFGIVSYAKVNLVEKNIEAIRKSAYEIYKKLSANLIKTFRITAHRSDKNFNMTSQEVAIDVGAFIVKMTGAKVKLNDPDININIAIEKERAYIFTHTYEGLGGLPIGCEGRIVCILKGRKEDLFNAFLCAKRGNFITFVSDKKDESSNKAFIQVFEEYYFCKDKLNLISLDEINKESLAKVCKEVNANIIASNELNWDLFSNEDYVLIMPTLPFESWEVETLTKKYFG